MKLFQNRMLALLGTGLLVLLAAGCVTESDMPPLPEAPKTEVRKAGGELLKAFVDNDAEGFLKLLPPVVGEEFGVNGFKKTRESMLKQLGTPVSYSFVLNLEHPKFTVSVWKVRFERKSSDGKRTIRQETMFRAVSGKVDGREKLLSFNFF